MIAMKFTIELDIGLSFLLQAALPQPSSALLGTRNRGRNPLSLDPEHREFEAKKEFGAECRDRRNQRRNKALLGGWCFSRETQIT